VSHASFRLRRPIARWRNERKYAACPRCQDEVSATLGAPAVPTLRLANQAPNRVDGDSINVRGYRCEGCRYVLAIAPTAAIVEVHDPTTDQEEEPTAPWVPIGAVFADGSKRPVVVPRREVAR